MFNGYDSIFLIKRSIEHPINNIILTPYLDNLSNSFKEKFGNDSEINSFNIKDFIPLSSAPFISHILIQNYNNINTKSKKISEKLFYTLDDYMNNFESSNTLNLKNKQRYFNINNVLENEYPEMALSYLFNNYRHNFKEFISNINNPNDNSIIDFNFSGKRIKRKTTEYPLIELFLEDILKKRFRSQGKDGSNPNKFLMDNPINFLEDMPITKEELFGIKGVLFYLDFRKSYQERNGELVDMNTKNIIKLIPERTLELIKFGMKNTINYFPKASFVSELNEFNSMLNDYSNNYKSYNCIEGTDCDYNLYNEIVTMRAFVKLSDRLLYKNENNKFHESIRNIYTNEKIDMGYEVNTYRKKLHDLEKKPGPSLIDTKRKTRKQLEKEKLAKLGNYNHHNHVKLNNNYTKKKKSQNSKDIEYEQLLLW